MGSCLCPSGLRQGGCRVGPQHVDLEQDASPQGPPAACYLSRCLDRTCSWVPSTTSFSLPHLFRCLRMLRELVLASPSTSHLLPPCCSLLLLHSLLASSNQPKLDSQPPASTHYHPRLKPSFFPPWTSNFFFSLEIATECWLSVAPCPNTLQGPLLHEAPHSFLLPGLRHHLSCCLTDMRLLREGDSMTIKHPLGVKREQGVSILPWHPSAM